MGIRYDSEKCLEFIDKVFGFKQKIEKAYNTELALEKGNFPSWNESIYAKTNTPARCATISTQAPTGSIASILNTTAYGIEPLFGVAVLRRIVTGEIYEANELFATMLHDIVKDDAKEQKIIKECYEKGTAQINSVPKKIRELFRCANDISPEWHVRTQAQFQKYYENAVSKTINAPENATKDELYDLLIKAWELKIKGVTYYRNNSRKNQTIQIGNSKNEHNIKLDSIQPISRSSMGKTYGMTNKYTTACGSFYLTINRDDEGNIVESFVNTSKNGTCKSNIDGLNRMLSLALRSGTKIDEIVDQLKGISCAACTRVKTKGERKIDGLSCPDIISRALEEEYKNKTKITTESIDIVDEIVSENCCPECKSPMQLAEGCSVCTNPDCGFSRCG
jgi:ribonucleoside-diphosphate reductase alpha chain